MSVVAAEVGGQVPLHIRRAAELAATDNQRLVQEAVVLQVLDEGGRRLIDGAALARIARELRPNLPVVYASGSYSKIEQLDAVSGAIFVPKPYNPDKLCEMLSEMAVAAH